MASDVYFFKTTTKTENSDRGFIPDTREKFVCNTKTTFDDDCRVFDFVMFEKIHGRFPFRQQQTTTQIPNRKIEKSSFSFQRNMEQNSTFLNGFLLDKYIT